MELVRPRGTPLGRVAPPCRIWQVDFLLPSSYHETAKQSANKDALLKTGAKVIAKRHSEFRIVSISCGARRAAACRYTYVQQCAASC